MQKFNLQVGDWVRDEHTPSPMRITIIGEDYAQATYAQATFGGNELKSWWFDEKAKLHGIPLTREILEKNEWEADEYLGLYERAGVDFTILYDLDSPGAFECHEIPSITLDTVDKLQRLLRLCGHGDLADKFRL